MQVKARMYIVNLKSLLRVFALFLAGVGAGNLLYSAALPVPGPRVLLQLMGSVSEPLNAGDKFRALPFLLGFDPGDPKAVAASFFPFSGEAQADSNPTPQTPRPNPKSENSEPPQPDTVVEKTFLQSRPQGYSPAGGLYVQNDSGHSFDLLALLKKKIDFGKQKGPKVLILHTHTSEAYLDETRTTSPYHSADEKENVVRVGAEIAAVLNEAGIETLHDKTQHDIPSYSGAYGRSAETAERHMRAYPSIEIILDIHRDAIQQSDGAYIKTIAIQGGRPTAQVMSVVGTDKSGLPHPNWQDNLAFALKIQQKLNELYPNLARPINLRTERFNGHISKGALLVEIGSNVNTLEEAIEGGRAFARALAEVIKNG